MLHQRQLGELESREGNSGNEKSMGERQGKESDQGDKTRGGDGKCGGGDKRRGEQKERDVLLLNYVKANAHAITAKSHALYPMVAALVIIVAIHSRNEIRMIVIVKIMMKMMIKKI